MTFSKEYFTCPHSLWGFGIGQSKKHRNTNVRVNLYKTEDPNIMSVKITGNPEGVKQCKKNFVDKITDNVRPTSPQRHSNSPQRHSNSPQRHSNSPHRHSNSPQKSETPLSKERCEELRWVLFDFQNDTESETIELKGYNSKERKVIHIEAGKLNMETCSSGDTENNRVIKVSKPDFLNNERKEELINLVKSFHQSNENEYYFDTKTTQEGEYVKKIAEDFDIIYKKIQDPEKKETRKCENVKNKVCFFWETGKCKFQNEPEKCHYLHGKLPLTKEEILDEIQNNTWIKLPSNHSIEKNEWFDYVESVHTGNYECCENIKIPLDEIIGWTDSTTTKWSTIEPITEIQLGIVKNPLYNYYEN